MFCQAFNESTGRQCGRVAWWRVQGLGDLASVYTCQYHVVQALDGITKDGVPATVLGLKALGGAEGGGSVRATPGQEQVQFGLIQ